MSSTLNLTEECIDLAATWDISTHTQNLIDNEPQKQLHFLISCLSNNITKVLCFLSVDMCFLLCLTPKLVLVDWLHWYFVQGKQGCKQYLYCTVQGCMRQVWFVLLRYRSTGISLPSNLAILGQTYCTILHLMDTASQIPSLLRVCCPCLADLATQHQGQAQLNFITANL